MKLVLSRDVWSSLNLWFLSLLVWFTLRVRLFNAINNLSISSPFAFHELSCRSTLFRLPKTRASNWFFLIFSYFWIWLIEHGFRAILSNRCLRTKAWEVTIYLRAQNSWLSHFSSRSFVNASVRISLPKFIILSRIINSTRKKIECKAYQIEWTFLDQIYAQT